MEEDSAAGVAVGAAAAAAAAVVGAVEGIDVSFLSKLSLSVN